MFSSKCTQLRRLQFSQNGLMHGSMILRAAISSTAPSAPALLLGLLLLTSP